MKRVLSVITLTLIWVALWSDLSVANVVWGLVIAIGVSFAFPIQDQGRQIRPLAALRYFVAFLGMLVSSTWEVVVEVLQPRLRLAPAIVAVRLRTDDPTIITLVANSITLTPGTLTVDVGPETPPGTGRLLYVHGLRVSSADVLVASAHQIEDLATAAFPPARPDRSAEAADPAPAEGDDR